MSGESDLNTLLASMEPVLNPGTWGFAHVPTLAEAVALSPAMTFQEAEAITVILPWDRAVAEGLSPEFPACWITLNIHSALEAVGFLARIVPRLAEAGMGVNPVAAFYHDHLFLPADRADEAMSILRAIAAEAAPG